MKRPSVFIGCASEGLRIAQGLQHELDNIADAELYNQGAFRPGDTNIGSLFEQTQIHDAAILVFTPDSEIRDRGQLFSAPRDNVVFELGLFMGQLGPDRAFVFYDKSENIKIPSDLNGVVFCPYDGHRFKTNPKAAIGVACEPIRAALERLEPLQRVQKNAQPVKRFGSLASGSLSFGRNSDRVIALFGYEKQGGSSSQLWRTTSAFDQRYSDDYEAWTQTKRLFESDEVIGTWFKIGHDPACDERTSGYTHLLKLAGESGSSHGSIVESNLHGLNSEYWIGEWWVEYGLLRTEIGEYTLTVVASRDGVHSGVEDNGAMERSSYFKLSQVKI